MYSLYHIFFWLGLKVDNAIVCSLLVKYNLVAVYILAECH